MPATSGRQRRYMASARARKRAGRPAKGDPKMSDAQFSDFMRMEAGKHHGMKRKGKH